MKKNAKLFIKKVVTFIDILFFIMYNKSIYVLYDTFYIKLLIYFFIYVKVIRNV